jgi:hypothetical protein
MPIAAPSSVRAADEADLPILSPEEFQRLPPDQLQRYARGHARQRLTKMRNQVATLVDQAVAEHAEGGVIVAENRFSMQQQWSESDIAEFAKAPAPDGFKAWKLGGPRQLGFEEPKGQLHHSAALEDFVLKRRLDNRSERPAERNHRIKQGELLFSYVGSVLAHSDAAHRAVACELLSYFPLEAIHQEFLTQMAELMRDDAIAFQGTKLLKELPPEDKRRYHLGEATVGEIAKLSLESIVGIRFASADDFDRWCKDNSDFRERLWYWRVRWHNHAFDIPLETINPRLGLKLMLLAPIESATESEALASWPPGERAGAHPPLQITYWGGGLYPSNTADYVRIHKLQGELVRIVQHEVDWPMVPDDSVLSVLYSYVLLPEDLPLLLRLLEDSQGALAPKARQPQWSDHEVVTHRTKLVRLAIDLAPDRAEEILVAELQRPAAGCLPGVDLMAISGLNHWDIIKAAALRDEFRDNVRAVVKALGKMKTPPARAALDDLLKSLHLDKIEEPRFQPDPSMAVYGLLSDLADAAKVLNGGPVVTNEQLDGAKVLDSSRGKGARPIPEEVAHNRTIPDARRQIVKQLGEFFAREK